jgi:hypothetical protein
MIKTWENLRDVADFASYLPSGRLLVTRTQSDGHEESWAALLDKEMAKLDRALVEKDPGRIRQSFQSFRTRASYRFYEVDLALKELCEQLRKVSEPLTHVWEMIK